MEYAKLGRTDLNISKLGFGGTGIADMYHMHTQDEATNAVLKALDLGINYFDASPRYGPEGQAETRLGIALEGHRNEIVLATKCGCYDHGKPCAQVLEYDYSAKRVRAEIENSLRRLRTDYVDIYQVHDVQNAASLTQILEETLPELEKLRDEGKIRYIGVTGYKLEALRWLVERFPGLDMVLNFACYNLVDTTLDGYFDDLRASRGLGVVNSSILYVGMLTMSIATLSHHKAEDKHVEFKKAIRKCIDICNERGLDLGEVAVTFGTHCPTAESTIIATGNPSRLAKNVELFERPVDVELCKEFHEILKGNSMFAPEPLKI